MAKYILHVICVICYFLYAIYYTLFLIYYLLYFISYLCVIYRNLVLSIEHSEGLKANYVLRDNNFTNRLLQGKIRSTDGESSTPTVAIALFVFVWFEGYQQLCSHDVGPQKLVWLQVGFWQLRNATLLFQTSKKQSKEKASPSSTSSSVNASEHTTEQQALFDSIVVQGDKIRNLKGAKASKVCIFSMINFGYQNFLVFVFLFSKEYEKTSRQICNYVKKIRRKKKTLFWYVFQLENE